MHSRKLNWTELFSSVQLLAVHWTGNDLRRFGDEIGGSRRLFTIREHYRESLDENRRRAATTADGGPWFLTVKNLRRPSPVVAARRRFNTQHQINNAVSQRTQVSKGPMSAKDSVEFIWVQFSTVHWVLGDTGTHYDMGKAFHNQSWHTNGDLLRTTHRGTALIYSVDIFSAGITYEQTFQEETTTEFHVMPQKVYKLYLQLRLGLFDSDLPISPISS